ncbi:EF-hand domain-containing protein [Reyranella sp.]|uniref:EF-hand domain-containing protein n=1 Tax=Reyranella sp. TaxID=1929291 RepID=UPI003BABCBE1
MSKFPRLSIGLPLVLPLAALVLLAGPVRAQPSGPPSAESPAARPAPASPARAQTAPGPAGRPARGIMRYDSNQDGVVDRAEWMAGQEARFRQLDADRDGRLTQDELFARSRATPANAVLPSDREAQRQSAYFQRLDADKDGSVSQAEFIAQAERNFARCDADKDGRTDAAECRQALQRNR